MLGIFSLKNEVAQGCKYHILSQIKNFPMKIMCVVLPSNLMMFASINYGCFLLFEIGQGNSVNQPDSF